VLSRVFADLWGQCVPLLTLVLSILLLEFAQDMLHEYKRSGRERGGSVFKAYGV